MIRQVIKIITKQLAQCSEGRNLCTLMLTGGSTAENLYKEWALSNNWDCRRVVCYFGDERCVPPYHVDSNYGMTVRALFPNDIPTDCIVERIIADSKYKDIEASRYDKLIPNSIDILLLSVGEDGHIASLFPESEVLMNVNQKMIYTVGPKPPYERLTITPKVIKSAKFIIVMASGKEKGRVLAKALKDPNNINKYPVTLTIGTTWILDKLAANSFENENKKNKNNYKNTRIIYA